MAIPTRASTKTFIATARDSKILTGIAALLFLVVVVINIASNAIQYHADMVELAFSEGTMLSSVPDNYQRYIIDIWRCFQKIDEVVTEIESRAEGEKLDRNLVKAVFYSQFFGTDNQNIEDEYYRHFVDCFVEYEEHTYRIIGESKKGVEETYTVLVPIKDEKAIFKKLSKALHLSLTYKDRENIRKIYCQVSEKELQTEEEPLCDQRIESAFSSNEKGNLIVEYAISRLGDPYSQELRGYENYTDCSYLTMWCYDQVNVLIPATASEQAKYCVENHLTISKEDLQPGDLVFWSFGLSEYFMNIDHVGVYAGEGMVVDVSYSKSCVVYRKLYDIEHQVLYGRPKEIE